MKQGRITGKKIDLRVFDLGRRPECYRNAS